MRNEKGFTLIGVVVAGAIGIIAIAIIGPNLLGFFHKGNVAAVSEDHKAVGDALKSAIMREQGHIQDDNGDGDLLDELITMNYLDRKPESIPGGVWRLKSALHSNGKTMYYLDIECTKDNCVKLAAELDLKSDQENGADIGDVQWSN